MDNRELNSWKNILELANEALQVPSGLAAAREARGAADEANDKIADFILNDSDTKQVRKQVRQVDQWRTAHNAISSVKDTDQSTILLVTLPATGNQVSKRVRIEQEHYLMVRQPIFMQYERALFEEDNRNFLGMTGPQGFGKSVFLHYLATKRAFGTSHLVVWVPFCPPSEETFKLVLANAFYTGCEAAELTGIPYLKFSQTMNTLLLKMKQFAEKEHKSLLVIVDQVHKNLSYYGILKIEIQSFAQANVGRGHVYVVSSSTSGDVSPLFGNVCKYLEPYDHLVTTDELKLLKSQHGAMNQDLLAKEPMSFLQTIGLLRGESTSLDELATYFVNELLAKLRAASPPDQVDIMTEYMFVLNSIAAKDAFPSSPAVSFRADLVDGDKFYVKKVAENETMIRAFMTGYGELVLAKLREKDRIQYDKFLAAIVGSDSFTRLAGGAKGILMEDCFFAMLEDETHPVTFSWTNMDGTRPTLYTLKIESREVLKFADIPQSIAWDHAQNCFVGLPPHGYIGIDFIVARVREFGKKKTLVLEVYFIQCTVSPPQKHPVKKSPKHKKWVDLFAAATGISQDNTSVSLIFLTPRKGSKPTVCAFPICYHSYFQKVEGNHGLVDRVKAACAKETKWDSV